MSKVYILPVVKRVAETADTISISFQQPPIDRIPYYAGQYITLKVEVDGKGYYRSYSMSSTPRLDDLLTITVKRVPGGIVSNYVHDQVKEGDLIAFLQPAGKFYVETATKHQRDIVCYAAGSGITPIMSIMRGVLFHEPQSTVRLLYSSKTPDEVIFQGQLANLAQAFPKRCSIQYVYTGPEIASDSSAWIGRITKDQVAAYASALPAAAEHYLCGPAGFMSTIQAGLATLNVSRDQIFQELFVADDSMKARQSEYTGPSHWVEVSYHGETHRIKVAPGMTILEAAINQGLELPHSCKRGICSSCMAQLEAGKMEMIHPEALLDFEKQRGKVLLCQAYPVSDQVKIHV